MNKDLKLKVWWDGDGYSPIETAPIAIQEKLKKLETQLNEERTRQDPTHPHLFDPDRERIHGEV